MSTTDNERQASIDHRQPLLTAAFCSEVTRRRI